MERSAGLLRRDPGELIARGVIAGLFLGLAYRIGLNVLETGRLSGILLVISELLVDHCMEIPDHLKAEE